MRRIRVSWLLIPAMMLAPRAFAIGQKQYVSEAAAAGSFRIAQGKVCAPLSVDSADWPGVIRAVTDLQSDIARVTGCTATIGHDASAGRIIIGTVGHSALIDQLIREGRIDASAIRGKWESFLIQTVHNNLVIAGSDKRGTIYGIYDLSEQIGVSPWYWWADVPAKHHDSLYVRPGRYIEGEPAVKYRGIFLNDEAPALSGWAKEKYGGLNHQVYEKVFELLLRLKANYLWPAMWDNAFNEDDPLDPKLADEYGIVMGTSHHEPMLRAQQEWKRHGTGPWNYATNGEVLRAFWDEGVERNRNYESIITVGMRGDGDMPMVEHGDMAANVHLLEKIVADQRAIIAKRVNPNLAAVPQDWALYKEVQEYYEKGMRVPDDVTLLWCDDNWGNIRRLPTPEERTRTGGAGIYYHFDYVGGPRNYKWVNTVPITKVWEQMSLAYEYDARRIWIVNIGDLKPMEFPIEYFLTLARDPRAWPHERIAEFTRSWAEREFGPEHAADIADIVSKYTKYNGRRKPELLEPGTFSLEDYEEDERVLAEWKGITSKAEQIYQKLPANQRDAFFELVLYPTKACAIVNEMYIAAAKNRLYASQKRASTNYWAGRVRRLFQADADLAAEYNHQLAGGKWDHMMDQTHIGYTYWQQPPVNKMPAVTEISVPEKAEMGVTLEGSAAAWPGAAGDPVLPQFDVYNRQRSYIDVFNRGEEALEFATATSAPWIVASVASGRVIREMRVWVSVDWNLAPEGSASGSVTLSGAGLDPVTVRVNEFRPREAVANAFVEGDGYVSIDAEHFQAKTDAGGVRWEKIADYGRTGSSMTILPLTAASATPENAPTLEYRMFLFHPEKLQVHAIIAPTLNFVPGRGLRFALSFDNEPPRIIDALEHNTQKDWEESVKDSVRDVTANFSLAGVGYHVLKFRMVDPGVVLQKLVVDCGGLRPSYLGPPESVLIR